MIFTLAGKPEVFYHGGFLLCIGITFLEPQLKAGVFFNNKIDIVVGESNNDVEENKY